MRICKTDKRVRKRPLILFKVLPSILFPNEYVDRAKYHNAIQNHSQRKEEFYLVGHETLKVLVDQCPFG
jgi:hypothetical protein